jgi:hypothetical protein
MLKLPVAPARPDVPPPVLFETSNQVADLHATELSASAV